MKKVSYLLLITMLFVGLVGCGDDSTGPDVGDAPETPDLEKAQPDVSFFEENNPQKASSAEMASTENYTHAQGIVLWNTVFFSFGQSYGMFISEVDREEATYNDGVWEWSYSLNYLGVSADYRTTAEVLSNSVRWASYWSYSDGQGDGFEDYKIFEGTVAKDESYGDWTFNALDPELDQERPFISSKWNITSETEKEINLVMYGEAIDDETSEETATIDFKREGSDFTMDLKFVDGQDYLVTWNIDTNKGSITYDGETRCWDENFEDTPCG